MKIGLLSTKNSTCSLPYFITIIIYRISAAKNSSSCELSILCLHLTFVEMYLDFVVYWSDFCIVYFLIDNWHVKVNSITQTVYIQKQRHWVLVNNQYCLFWYPKLSTSMQLLLLSYIHYTYVIHHLSKCKIKQPKTLAYQFVVLLLTRNKNTPLNCALTVTVILKGYIYVCVVRLCWVKRCI
jgi:hypothetical protein